MRTYICSRCGQALPKRRLRSRTKRKIAKIVCGISGLVILGIVGGLENFWLPLQTGALWLASSLAVFTISAMKGGIIR